VLSWSEALPAYPETVDTAAADRTSRAQRLVPFWRTPLSDLWARLGPNNRHRGGRRRHDHGADGPNHVQAGPAEERLKIDFEHFRPAIGRCRAIQRGRSGPTQLRMGTETEQNFVGAFRA
jgi:hypothetical protein